MSLFGKSPTLAPLSRRAFIAGSTALVAATMRPLHARAQGSSDTLRIGQLALGGENMDPAMEVRSTVMQVHMMLYDCIVEIGPNNEIIPGIAESWATDDSGKVWTFTIREGAEFHGGYGPVTAEDVAFSLNRFMDPEVATSGRTVLVNMIESVEVTGPREVTITTKDVFSGLLYTLSPHQTATGIVFSKKYLTEQGGATYAEQTALMNQHPIGSGPYEFEGRTRGQGMTFRAVDSHWRVSPAIRRVEWLMIPDPSTQLFMLQSGELDLIPLDPDRAEQAKSSEGIGISTIPNGLDYGLNVYASFGSPAKDLPTANPRVRHAMSKAIDRKVIIESLMSGYAALPQAPWGVATNADGLDLAAGAAWAEDLATYDPEGAKELLAEAGYPDGFSGIKVYMAQLNSGLPNTTEVTLAVVAQLAKVGINIEVVPMEYTNLRPYIVGNPEDPFIAGQIIPFSNQPRMTAENFLDVFFRYSGEENPGKTQLLNSPELNALIAEMGQTLDNDARTAVGTKAFDMVRGSWTSIPVLTADTIYGANTGLVGSWAPRPGYGFLARQIELIQTPA